MSEVDSNVLYVGMGETSIRSNVSRGDGVYKSTNAGRTWEHVGLSETQNIGRIKIDPADPQLVYVAALGHVWGPNEDRGIFRSSNGGASWERILFKNNHTGAIDVVIDPTNHRILYASFWEASRSPYGLSSGGPSSSMYRSEDCGETWTDITRNPGIPAGLKGKIGLTASALKPGRLWASIEHEAGGIFRSEDYGFTWSRENDNRNLRQRAWYFSHIYADPGSADTVWVLNVQLWKSVDGGANFVDVPVPHADSHDLWIDRRNPNRMALATDGGATVSLSGGRSWSSLYNQPTGEYYHVVTDNRIPYRVYGAQQDSTTISVPSRSNTPAIVMPEWREVGGGESGSIVVRPDDPDIVYAGSMSGYLSRYDFRTDLVHDISPWPEEPTGGAEDLEYRWQWTSPIALSPHDPTVLYSGANQVFRSKDEGRSWEIASPDLTRADPETLRSSGGPITQDNSGAETYATIFALAESPVAPGVIWAGSDDGLLHVSLDNGESWKNVGIPWLPDWALISTIEPSPHDAGTAYVAATCYKSHDDRPYLFRTHDYGETWTLIVNGIPNGEFTRVIREDPEKRGLLFAGTERGLHVSFDDGSSWQSLQLNLPIVPVHDLVVAQGDLVVATHGRSFWILDDISPLRQLEADTANRATHLFVPRPTYRFPEPRWGYGRPPVPGKNYWTAGGTVVSAEYRVAESGDEELSFLDAGNNPPNGVFFHYYLRDKPSDKITLSIWDEIDRLVRRFESNSTEFGEPSLPASQGVNRFVWDMRYAEPEPISGTAQRGRRMGPKAPPGIYRAQLSAEGQDYIHDFQLWADPRLDVTPDAYVAQFNLQAQIRDKLTALNSAVNLIRDVRSQLNLWESHVAHSDLLEMVQNINRELFDIEGELIQNRATSVQDKFNFPLKLDAKLASLLTVVENSPGAPTQQADTVFRILSDRTDAQLSRLNHLIDGDISIFNRTFVASGPKPLDV